MLRLLKVRFGICLEFPIKCFSKNGIWTKTGFFCRFKGMTFGTGSAIARRAVDAMLGPQVIQHETVASSAPADAPPAQRNTSGKAYDACGGQYKALQEVMSFNV